MEDSDSTLREDYSWFSDEEIDNEVLYLDDIKIKIGDQNQLSESQRISDILAEFENVKTFSNNENIIIIEEEKVDKDIRFRADTIISVGTLNEYCKFNDGKIPGFKEKLEGGLKEPIHVQADKINLNKHFSVEQTIIKSPYIQKAKRSKTHFPRDFKNSEENILIPQHKKNVIEWTDHGKMIVLFAANLFCANQMVNLAQVIESIGLEYKNDKLALANVYRIYSVYFYKDNNLDLAIKEWDKAIKLFRSWKSIQGTAQCYLLKAFLRTNIQSESSCWSVSEDEEEKKILDSNDLIDKYDKKIRIIENQFKYICCYNKIRDLILQLHANNDLWTVELINTITKFFIIPIMSTESEKDEEFSPKVEKQKPNKGIVNSRFKVYL